MKNTNSRNFEHDYKQDFQVKACKECDKEFKPAAPAHLYCSNECARRAYITRYVGRAYNISIEEYDELWSDPYCRICRSEGFVVSRNGGAKLAIDHDHETGTVRGLLCPSCNQALGLLKDSPDILRAAIHYLEGATTISTESTNKCSEAHSSEGLSSDDDIV